MATLAELKPYIDLGMTAQIIRPWLLADGGDLEQATLYIYKFPRPENEKGFTGFYYYDYYDPTLHRKSCGCCGGWLVIKRFIDGCVVNSDHESSSIWTLDPSKHWEWRQGWGDNEVALGCYGESRVNVTRYVCKDERSNCMSYGKLEQCMQQLSEQEELLRHTKTHLEQELAVVAQSLAGDQARRDLFNYMYWGPNIFTPRFPR